MHGKLESFQESFSEREFVHAMDIKQTLLNYGWRVLNVIGTSCVD